MSKQKNHSSDLDLLIVVPAYNEEGYIEDCLSSIGQSLEKTNIKYDVVVVDNGSSDSTAAKVRDKNVDLIILDRSSVSRARNIGARHAASKFIAFIDADVLITPGWATAFSGLLSGSTSALLTGFQYSIRSDAGWIEENWFNHIKDKLLNGGNIIVSRAAYESVNGFDEGLKTGEDYDFCKRIIEGGVAYFPDSRFIAIHLGYPRNIGSFIRREVWHGEGDFRSLTTFARSPIAMIGVLYFFISLFIIIGLLSGFYFAVLSVVASLFLINLALTCFRFPKAGVGVVIVNSAINYLYFLARGFSFFRAIKNLTKRY